MSTNIYKNLLEALTIVAALSLMCLLAHAQAMQKPDAVQFERESHEITAKAPHGGAAIVMLPASGEDTDPLMKAISGTRKISLGPLRRSAQVIWNEQGSVAILWDLAYSNNYFLRAVKTSPAIHEISGFDRIIRNRVRAKFHPAQMIHYWPWVLGWKGEGVLAVVVCADGAKSMSPSDTEVVGFSRGYELDVVKQIVTKELAPDEYITEFGTNPCE